MTHIITGALCACGSERSEHYTNLCAAQVADFGAAWLSAYNTEGN